MMADNFVFFLGAFAFFKFCDLFQRVQYSFAVQIEGKKPQWPKNSFHLDFVYICRTMFILQKQNRNKPFFIYVKGACT